MTKWIGDYRTEAAAKSQATRTMKRYWNNSPALEPKTRFYPEEVVEGVPRRAFWRVWLVEVKS